ncbi:hypothetical protein ACFL6C_09470 [Myxococcota bacterium]
MKRSCRQKDRGQAMTEYSLIAAAFAGALFLPVWPDPESGGQTSTFLLFVKLFDIYINSFHSVISLPVP